MKRVVFALLVAAGVLLLPFSPLTSGDAKAHETREADSFEFIVGFSVEPAYEGQPNAAFIAIAVSKDDSEEGHEDEEAHVHGDEGDAVSEIDDGIPNSVDLQVEVAYPAIGNRVILPVEPTGERPGEYQAEFIPTAPGTYSFRFFGEVDGKPIDETFVGGPETFSDVSPTSELEFPVKLASEREIQNSAIGAFAIATSAQATADGNRVLIWSVLAVSIASLVVTAAAALWRIRK